MAVRNRIILWGLIGIFLIAALIFAFRPQPVPVDLATIANGPMAVAIDEEGETRVRDMFVVSAPVSGDMERVILEPGDRVVTGKTILTKINPTSSAVLDQRTEAQMQASVQAARSAINIAESDIERLRSDHVLAIKERDRMRPLLDRDYVSQSAFDKAEAAVNTAAAALHAAEAALGMRRSELQIARSALMPRIHRTSGSEHIDLTAPIDGVVLQVSRESAGPIAQGSPIMDIGDPSDIEIVADLLSEDAVRIAPGDPVEISGWGGGMLQGTVRVVEPFAFTKISALGIEEQRVNVIIDFAVPEDAAGLGHGYRVDVAVVTWREDAVLSVPMTALFRQGDIWQVYVDRNGRAVLSDIEVGEMNGRYAQILGGLSEGDRVIEHPSGRIDDGSRIVDRRKAEN